uniref:P-loop containing nucleoside triphosphate hydrolase protein n=1 Tax=Macrostomum lignano TaxID=282301 RepID=A0A1I8HNN7_9PLAT
MPLLLRAKTIVLGDAAAGKSALVQTFHSDGQHFPKNYNMTLGVELLVKAVTPPAAAPLSSRVTEQHQLQMQLQQQQQVQVELHIYDCAGQEAYADVVEGHAEGPDLCVLTYDVTSEASFEKCRHWLGKLQRLVERGRGSRQMKPSKPQQQEQQVLAPIPTALVALKSDLDNRRIVTPSQGQELAQSAGLAYFEASAKDGQGVEQPFLELARRFADLYAERCAQVCELVS